MSQPSAPPPYDAVYTQGVQTQPVSYQPLPQVHTQPVYMVQPQPQYTVHGRGGGSGLVVSTADGPTVVVCPSCNHMIRTNTVMAPGMRTHLCALLLCVCGLWPCCPIPYCIPACNNVDHFCPNCQAHIGSFTG